MNSGSGFPIPNREISKSDSPHSTGVSKELWKSEYESEIVPYSTGW